MTGLYEGWSAGRINRALDTAERERARLCDEFIAAGRGHELPSETRAKSDPLALRYCDAEDRFLELRREVARRYGPGAPRRLPTR
jgi:hypothetical protein